MDEEAKYKINEKPYTIMKKCAHWNEVKVDIKKEIEQKSDKRKEIPWCRLHVQDRGARMKAFPLLLLSLLEIEDVCLSKQHTRRYERIQIKQIYNKHRSRRSDDDKANDETSLTGWGFLFLSFFRGNILKMTFVRVCFYLFILLIVLSQEDEDEKMKLEGMLRNVKKNKFKFSEIFTLAEQGRRTFTLCVLQWIK